MPSPAFPLTSRLVYPLTSTDSYTGSVTGISHPNQIQNPDQPLKPAHPTVFSVSIIENPILPAPQTLLPHPINQDIMSVLHTHTHTFIHSFIHSDILSTHHMSSMILNTQVHEKKETKILPFNFLNLTKGIYRKPKANVTECGEILDFPSDRRTARKPICTISMLPEVLQLLAGTGRQEKKQTALSGMDDAKRLIHNVRVHVEKPKESIKNLLTNR